MKSSLSAIALKDHPRLRGEHHDGSYKLSGDKGSPPPTRGTRIKMRIYLSGPRITPAYAGNTPAVIQVSYLLQDHPRLRGEHAYKQVGNYEHRGSPPPTRGTLSCITSIILKYRITPAYAGNTKKKFIKRTKN